MEKIIAVRTIDELDAAASAFLESCGESRVFAFYGEMGAGKTTFIKAVCKALGVSDNTSSPTFSIVNEYRTEGGKSIFHFDFYRLKSEQEAYDLGYEEYFYSGSYCFIEWPERIPTLLPPGMVKVTVAANANGSRSIRIS